MQQVLLFRNCCLTLSSSLELPLTNSWLMRKSLRFPGGCFVPQQLAIPPRSFLEKASKSGVDQTSCCWVLACEVECPVSSRLYQYLILRIERCSRIRRFGTLKPNVRGPRNKRGGRTWTSVSKIPCCNDRAYEEILDY